MKAVFQQKVILKSFIVVCISMLFVSCSGGFKKETTIEHKEVFVNKKWNGFHKPEFEADIKDTTSAYSVVISMEYTPEMDMTLIPVIFSIYSPNGGESHTQTDLVIDESTVQSTDDKSGNTKRVEKVIYKKRYFPRKGKYRFQFFQKSSKYDIEGVKNVTIKIKSLKEEE